MVMSTRQSYVFTKTKFILDLPKAVWLICVGFVDTEKIWKHFPEDRIIQYRWIIVTHLHAFLYILMGSSSVNMFANLVIETCFSICVALICFSLYIANQTIVQNLCPEKNPLEIHRETTLESILSMSITKTNSCWGVYSPWTRFLSHFSLSSSPFFPFFSSEWKRRRKGETPKGENEEPTPICQRFSTRVIDL